MHHFFSLLFNFCFLFSCGQVKIINDPLPTNEKKLNTFPKDIQGSYLNKDDNSILTIRDFTITKTYDFDLIYTKDSISPNYYIKGDTLFNKYSDDREKILLSGDTIIQHIHKSDILFEISKKNVLKKYKGHYFLNESFNESDWIVTIISVKKGVMSVSGINDITIKDLEDLTNDNFDTTSFDINKVKKHLKNVICQNGIGRSKYLRLTENGM